MSRLQVFFLILTIILLLVDLYAFKGVWNLSRNASSVWKSVWRWGYWIPTAVTLGGLVYVFLNFNEMSENRDFGFAYWLVAFTMVFFIPKLFFSVFHIVDDLVHFVRWIVAKWQPQPTGEGVKINRLQFINQAGLAVSAVVFAGMFYGVTSGRFAFRFIKKNLRFTNLPPAFDGLRIVQISDAHLGSFLGKGKKEVARVFEKVNALNPDLILFTGDMINNYAIESDEWIDLFSKLKAREGKFAILGNHDYGDYVNWPDSEARNENLNNLKKNIAKMGFGLMLNQSSILEKEGQKIAIIGVENWGVGFHRHGDLQRAKAGTEDIDFKILMSHDPTHWEEQVVGKEKIDLTLSGHTHGMQFGLEIPTLGIKISPARLRYKHWGGLYKENDQFIYVNRGFGYLGFPGRVGMPPEVTVFDLARITG
jgi:predicted MPP superfamily phosphohydrolase